MCGADVVKLYAGELFQGVLNRRAVFSDDVRVVAYHFQPEAVTVHVRVYHGTVKRAETSESIARKQYIGRSVECYHCLWPVHHGSKHKLKGMFSQAERIAVFHLHTVVGNAIEPCCHVKCLLVANHLHARIILLYQCQRTAVVRFHVVYHHIVNRFVSYDIAYVFEKLEEEIPFDSVDKTHLLVVYDIRVVRNTVGQWPQTLEQMLVAVVYTDIKHTVCNLFHVFYILCL